MSSNTQRSKELMEKRGYVCAVVEKWNPHAFRGDGGQGLRQDLFGFLDILCLGTDEIVGVQTTSVGVLKEHIEKIAAHENVDAVRKSGMKILVHGWFKQRGRWHVREVDVS